jgi:hypothetical protein
MNYTLVEVKMLNADAPWHPLEECLRSRANSHSGIDGDMIPMKMTINYTLVFSQAYCD